MLREPSLVSVIVPTHNRAYILWRAIGSVLGQTYPNLELIIVDDASEDCTRRLVEEFHDDRVRYLQPSGGKRGAAASRNCGLAHAKGDLIAHLDSDNWWLPAYLERMVAAARDNPSAAFFYSGQMTTIWERSAAGEWTQISRRSLPRAQYTLDHARDLRWPDVSCMFHRVEVSRVVGGFDEQLWWLDDWDFFFRVLQAFPSAVRWVPGELVEYRQVHGEGADGICAEARESGREIEGRRQLLQKWGTQLSRSAMERLSCSAESIRPLRAST